MWKFVLAYLIIVNIVAFALYGADKKRAEKHQWRIKESVLIGIAAIGGSIGAIVGMQTYRHKTKHLKFTIGVPMILGLQMFVVLAIVSQII